MELIERAGFLTILQSLFDNVAGGEGHTVFVSGEAGIGKTSLVKAFCKDLTNDANIYTGTCDALFTPRPLAPLYDILMQMQDGLPEIGSNVEDRTAFFTKFYHDLKSQKGINLIIFEDIHWADEATLDFIKFLARRITQLLCLFILTYRDNEIHTRHPLRNVLGQLSPGSFTRMLLPPFSRQAVEKLAEEKGYSGEVVYHISGGNPFYVNEILAGYSAGIPDNIKDSILSVYNRLDERTKHIWEVLSIMPTALDVRTLGKLEPAFAEAIENCLETKILLSKKDPSFKNMNWKNQESHLFIIRVCHENSRPLLEALSELKIEQAPSCKMPMVRSLFATHPCTRHAASVGSHVAANYTCRP
jgi:hypothetical protein